MSIEIESVFYGWLLLAVFSLILLADGEKEAKEMVLIVWSPVIIVGLLFFGIYKLCSPTERSVRRVHRATEDTYRKRDIVCKENEILRTKIQEKRHEIEALRQAGQKQLNDEISRIERKVKHRLQGKGKP